MAQKILLTQAAYKPHLNKSLKTRQKGKNPVERH